MGAPGQPRSKAKVASPLGRYSGPVPTPARSQTLLLALLVLAAAAAFLGLRRWNAANQAAPSAAAARPLANPGQTGRAQISGRVTFTGRIPESREPASVFPECGQRVAVPPLQVSADGGVANAFVWVKDGLPPGDYPVPADKVLLDQHDCEYSPHVFGIRPGQPLEVRNGDHLLHNVNARGSGAGLSRGPNAFNVAMPLQGLKVVRSFGEPQVAVMITCDVHPWMRAYAGVVPHPFFAVTGPGGAFTLTGLPAGSYTVEAWHERLGRTTALVQVAEGASAQAALTYQP